MIWALPETTGLTPLKPEMFWLMASASLALRVVALPAPERAPPCEILPNMIVSRLVPRPDNWLLTDALAPSPRATMAMTAATPMMMPSVVRMLRPLLARSAEMAEGMVCSIRIRLLADAGDDANIENGSFAEVGRETDPTATALTPPPAR